MMFKFKTIAIAITIGLLAGCGFFQKGGEYMPQDPEPTINSNNTVRLKVSKIEVVSEFSPSFRRPNVEHLFPTTLEKNARTWARENLEAVDYGSDRTATFIIKDASVVESLEPAERAFYKDRNKYHAQLNVILKITDGKSLSRAQTEIQAWRDLLIPVDTPLIDKEKYWDDMSTKLFDEFNTKMRENIEKYLNMYVEGSTSVTDYSAN